jgi:hypothetical protein
MLSVSRLDLAIRHAAATARLLKKEPMTTSASVMTRAWLESSARALWLIDSDLGAREMVGRALADWLEEGRQIERLRATRVVPDMGVVKSSHQSIPEIVDEAASENGFEVIRRAETGEIKGIRGFTRPNTFDLLTKIDAGGVSQLLPMMTRSMYRRSSASAHGSFLAWGEALAARQNDGQHEPASAWLFASDVLSTLDVHVRAMRARNTLIEWSPQDLMAESERSALSTVMLAALEMSPSRLSNASASAAPTN